VKPYPLAFEDKKLAEEFPYRCSDVVTVILDIQSTDAEAARK
jgi:hypothetical protein